MGQGCCSNGSHFSVSSVIQTNNGEEKKSQNQRKPGTVENAYFGCAQERCKYLIDLFGYLAALPSYLDVRNAMV